MGNLHATGDDYKLGKIPTTCVKIPSAILRLPWEDGTYD